MGTVFCAKITEHLGRNILKNNMKGNSVMGSIQQKYFTKNEHPFLYLESNIHNEIFPVFVT